MTVKIYLHHKRSALGLVFRFQLITKHYNPYYRQESYLIWTRNYNTPLLSLPSKLLRAFITAWIGLQTLKWALKSTTLKRGAP